MAKSTQADTNAKHQRLADSDRAALENNSGRCVLGRGDSLNGDSSGGSSADRGAAGYLGGGRGTDVQAGISGIAGGHQDQFAFQSAKGLTPQNFAFHTHGVRIVLRDGEPWFIASDVAIALGYRDAANAARNLKEHQKDTQIMSTLGGEQKVTIINESGLYKLVLRSRKPEAEEFSDWVTGEVLPSIRKTGRYEKPPAPAQAQPTMQQIESAMSAAEAVAGPVKRTVMDAILKDSASWMHSRWLVSFVSDSRYGAPAQVSSIPMDAFVSSVDELARMIAEPGNGLHFSDVMLANLAAACNQRLAQRMAYQAIRKSGNSLAKT